MLDKIHVEFRQHKYELGFVSRGAESYGSNANLTAILLGSSIMREDLWST